MKNRKRLHEAFVALDFSIRLSENLRDLKKEKMKALEIGDFFELHKLMQKEQKIKEEMVKDYNRSIK